MADILPFRPKNDTGKPQDLLKYMVTKEIHPPFTSFNGIDFLKNNQENVEMEDADAARSWHEGSNSRVTYPFDVDIWTLFDDATDPLFEGIEEKRFMARWQIAAMAQLQLQNVSTGVSIVRPNIAFTKEKIISFEFTTGKFTKDKKVTFSELERSHRKWPRGTHVLKNPVRVLRVA